MQGMPALCLICLSSAYYACTMHARSVQGLRCLLIITLRPRPVLRPMPPRNIVYYTPFKIFQLINKKFYFSSSSSAETTEFIPLEFAALIDISINREQIMNSAMFLAKYKKEMLKDDMFKPMDWKKSLH